MVVRADAGLIAEVDRRAGLRSLGADGRVGDGLPLPNRLRVLLVGTHHRPLRGHPQSVQHPAHRLLGQRHAEPSVKEVADHPASPQRELETQLPRVFAAKYRIHRPRLLVGELTRPTRDRFRGQRLRPLLLAGFHPGVHRGTAKTQRVRHIRHLRAAIEDLAHRTDPKILERFVIEPSAVILPHESIQP